MMGNIGYWKRIETKRAVSIAEKILEGLSVIHEKRIVHRDIKPENILIENDIPKIADLGIGRMLRADEMASTTVGTLFYMSPEMLYRETGTGFNTDIWSFGIMLYEMLCGQFPFGITDKTPPGKVMDLIMDERVPVLFPEDAGIPLHLQEVLKKALCKDPKNRYQTINEFLEELRNPGSECDGIEYSKEIAKEIDEIKALMQDPVKLGTAEVRLKELVKKYPDCSRIYLVFGEFYNMCGNHDRAIEMFRNGIAKDGGNSLLHWGLAIANHKKGNTKTAAASLRKALELGLEKSMERYARLLLKTLESKE